MAGQAPPWLGSWIWTDARLPERNAFVRFRRRVQYDGGPARLRITADSRYVLYVDGEWVGQGPARSWPAHWQYDEHDLSPYLHPGENVLAVLVQRFGEGNFQYVWAGDHPGLLAQLDLDGQVIATDGTWRASPDPALVSAVPRISVQEGFEEAFDARLGDGWESPDYSDEAWPSATVLRPAADGVHRDLSPRSIPSLTREPVLPRRVVSAETVESTAYRFTVYGKPYLLPEDFTSNMVYCHAYLATRIWAPAAVEVRLLLPHKAPGPIKVNGVRVEQGESIPLHAGWNDLVARIRHAHHLPEYVVCFDGPPGLRFSASGLSASGFSASGDDGDSPWAIVGPFGLDERDRQRVHDDKDATILVAAPLTPAATSEAGDALWESGRVRDAADQPYFQRVRAEHLPAVDAFVQAYTDRVTGEIPLDSATGRAGTAVGGLEALLSGVDWAVVEPTPDGRDVRLLLDFGAEVVGYHSFEVVAPAGTVLDFHNFEFIQPDGRYNFAEGMNNSLRYVCREGRQTYQTYARRGFQYTYLILRNLTGRVYLGRVRALVATYPQTNRGSFASSDAKLDQIWRVGARTLRLCAEDSYTDCPTYEQTGWVGDARNEALVDWVVNGDPRLWYRHLELAAQSLDRSPIVESHVPSAWEDLLPAWTFLWMRSCREYYLFTGDRARALKLLEAIERNVVGVRQYLDADGLFDIRAWNMFDWAAMDTPTRGVVTHQNCLAVHALRDAAELAEWLGAPERAREWRDLAASIARGVNARLWVEEKGAYTDCLRDGKPSPVFSQQTQTVACMSGVAEGERGRLARAAMHSPPEGFVRAGSPFFEFFLLEAYQQEERVQEFVDTIRRDWGFMVDMGASTFWEMWSGHSGRLTRSHCHGWSAAPTYFLSTYVLGVRPGGPGFAPTIVEPHPGDLRWCRGVVPTPLGDVEVQWENEPDRPFVLRVATRGDVEVRVVLPRAGSATVDGRTV